jgi:hypothetical protein
MEFSCEDLRDAGIVLVPPSSPEYGPLLTNIEQRLSCPPLSALSSASSKLMAPLNRQDPTAAVLLNQSGKAIAAWTLVWKYEEFEGRQYSSSYTMGSRSVPSLLLPFGMPEAQRKFASYWEVILPGSARYVSGGDMFGDNSDVRLPTPEERRNGGGIGSGGSRRDPKPIDQMKYVTLAVDGMFFSDGEFVGPNQHYLFENVACWAEAHHEVAVVAHGERERGADTRRILASVAEVTGPVDDGAVVHERGKGDLTGLRREAKSHIAWVVSAMQKMRGDEAAASMLVSWAAGSLPQYRRS